MQKTATAISILITVFLLQSCMTRGLQRTYETRKNYPKSVFNDSVESRVFKTTIDLYENHFSGMLIVKKVKPKVYRTVFVNEIGMKFFDFTISDKNFMVNYIFDALNRKMLLKLFENDFRLLLMNNVNFEKSKVYNNKNREITAYKVDKNMYLTSTKNNNLISIKNYSLLRKRGQILFSNYTNNFPKTIFLRHYNLKFTMKLSLIK